MPIESVGELSPPLARRSEIALLLRRSLFVALVLGCGVSLLASGRFTLRLIADGTLSFAFVPLCELLGFAVVWRGLPRASDEAKGESESRGRRAIGSFARAADQFFATNTPWLWWMVGVMAAAAIVPASRHGSLLGPLLMTAPVPILLSAVLEWRFFRREMGRGRGRTAADLLLQRLIAWTAASLYFFGIATMGRDFFYLFVEMGQEIRNWVGTML